jgi:hypothetical protein
VLVQHIAKQRQQQEKVGLRRREWQVAEHDCTQPALSVSSLSSCLNGARLQWRVQAQRSAVQMRPNFIHVAHTTISDRSGVAVFVPHGASVFKQWCTQLPPLIEKSTLTSSSATSRAGSMLEAPPAQAFSSSIGQPFKSFVCPRTVVSGSICHHSNRCVHRHLRGRLLNSGDATSLMGYSNASYRKGVQDRIPNLRRQFKRKR